MKKDISIHWFRQDLRIDDNPSLNHLSIKGIPVLLIFILDEVNTDRPIGEASKIWLNRALIDLNQQVKGKIMFFKGNPKIIFSNLLSKFNVKNVSWNRCYEVWRVNRDNDLKKFLTDKVDDVKSFNGSLLWEPWEVLKKDKSPYKVFTPYYQKGCLESKPPRKPITKKIEFFNHNFADYSIENLKLDPKKKWSLNILKEWEFSKNSISKVVENFFEFGIKNYKEGRNFPIKKNVSRLAPYIRWGQVSPHFLWHKCDQYKKKVSEQNLKTFKSQLGWREFSYYLLFHFPKITKKNLHSKFDKFPWISNKKVFNSWSRGLTGYPIVDAGMRELYLTGYMHNRVRMIVGSFLVKNLLHHWKFGENWFWNCLFDADIASNSASWQWVAGTGADAAPYFRIFNPIIQGKKFDPKGKYTKKYIPELRKLHIKYLFNPWDCPEEILQRNGIKLGKNYPFPIVDLKLSREKALSALLTLKEKTKEL